MNGCGPGRVPVGVPGDRSRPDRGDTRYARAVRACATIAWLVALLLVCVGLLPGMWPLEKATMFATSRSSVAVAYIVGYTESGVDVPMPAEDFGVAPTEFSAQLGRAILPDVGPEDRWVLAELAAWWNIAHPDRRVVVVHLRVKVTDPRGGFAEHHETLLSWAGP